MKLALITASIAIVMLMWGSALIASAGRQSDPAPARQTASVTQLVRSELPSAATAYCPHGYLAIAGGFTAPDRVEFADLLHDGVTPYHHGWTVKIRALVGAGTAHMRVYAICALQLGRISLRG